MTKNRLHDYFVKLLKFDTDLTLNLRKLYRYSNMLKNMNLLQ